MADDGLASRMNDGMIASRIDAQRLFGNIDSAPG
jgi:hypothetical protein